MSWRSDVARWGPWCGILVPAIDALINGVVAAAQPNYHVLDDYISDLSAPDVPYSSVIRGWWIAFPILFFPFALDLFSHLPKGKLRWAPAALLVGFTVGLFFCGVFHCDPGCAGKTATARAHFMSSYAAAAALYLSPLGLALASWDDERWRRWQWINFVGLTFGAAAGIALFLAGKHIVPHRGLQERVFFGVFYTWVVLVALRLILLQRAENTGFSDAS
jgi:hypothetical membrane protein